MSQPREVIIQFNNRLHFLECLKVNPGIIVVKFGADWCGPCRSIKELLEHKFSQCASNIICCDLNVDDNADVYGFFKKNRQLNGIPSILAFFKGNVTPFANLSVSGANVNEINVFFDKCNETAKKLV